MEVYDIGQVHIITSDDDPDALLGTEEALTQEEQDWLMWLSSMWDDTSDDEPAIEDDYEDIRRGC